MPSPKNKGLRYLALLGLSLTLSSATIGCSYLGDAAGALGAKPSSEEAAVILTPTVNHEPTTMSLAASIQNNRSRAVDPLFEDHPTVIDDAFGLETSQRLFKNSASLIVAADTVDDQLRAGSLAVFAHCPMLVYSPDNHSKIVAEIERLQVRRVLLVGKVGISESTGTSTVFRDPGTLESLGKLTAHRFTEKVISDDADVIYELSRLNAGEPIMLRRQSFVDDRDPATVAKLEERARALPLQTRRDGLNAPVTVATSETSVAALANAQAYGAQVRFLDTPDPRASDTALAAMAGLSDQPLLALGRQFGTGDQLSRRISQAEHTRRG